jgi:hypothetical protein
MVAERESNLQFPICFLRGRVARQKQSKSPSPHSGIDQDHMWKSVVLTKRDRLNQALARTAARARNEKGEIRK